MNSMTYGTLPSRREFVRQFDLNVPDGIYRIRPPKVRPALVGVVRPHDDISGDYKCSELWQLVKDLTREWQNGSDEAGDWASDILGTLGFEWI